MTLALVCVSVPLQIIVSDILSIYIFFFHFRKSNTIMLTNIGISTIYNGHGFYRFFFFTTLSRYSNFFVKRP